MWVFKLDLWNFEQEVWVAEIVDEQLIGFDFIMAKTCLINTRKGSTFNIPCVLAAQRWERAVTVYQGIAGALSTLSTRESCSTVNCHCRQALTNISQWKFLEGDSSGETHSFVGN